MLKTLIQQRIKSHGAISLADYMMLCLYHPEQGYYSQNVALGQDFATAPEVSQMFGEMVGLWCLLTWQQMGSPERVDLVELGPGRGVMMADILRVAQKDPGFTSALQAHMIETSPVLSQIQQSNLQAFENCHWHKDLSTLGDASKIILGNEFFDAFPVRQYIKQNHGWHERLVSLDTATEEFYFVVDAQPAQLGFILDTMVEAAEGSLFEMPVSGLYAYADVLQLLKQCGGAGLFIDYGHEVLTLGSTTQAMAQGKTTDFFAQPGKQDLTTYVQFGLLKAEAEKVGLFNFGTVTQAQWLETMGLGARAEMLAQKNPSATIMQDYQRLVDPEGMGGFRVYGLCVDPNLKLPGFMGG